MVCWDCGKKGHTKNNCKIKWKIYALSISDEKKQLLELLNDEEESELELLEVEDSESYNWNSNQELDFECNHYKAIMNHSGLSINMIAAQ